jgi:hypothetical protein
MNTLDPGPQYNQPTTVYRHPMDRAGDRTIGGIGGEQHHNTAQERAGWNDCARLGRRGGIHEAI